MNTPRPRPAGPGRKGASLLREGDRAQLEARKRRGTLFRWLTIVPVVLAVTLILTLLLDVLDDTVVWQVVEPSNSGASFGFGEGRTFRQLVRLELTAQGETAEDADALLNDPEELRKFRARNRVELLWLADGRPLRFVVTNMRDDVLETYGFVEGLRVRSELEAGLQEGQHLYLNPMLDWGFLTRNNSGRAAIAGLATALVGSLWVLALVLLFSIPIGVGTAIYLEEYATDNIFTRLLEVNIRNLAGVPSIVYGILGLYVFVRGVRFGPTVLSAALTLSLLILPVVVIAAREAIRSVPGSLRQASYGLGATRWQTVRQVVLPNAVGGIVTGVVLAVARAIGETAPLLLVGGAGFITKFPDGPLSNFTVMPTQIYSWVNAPQQAFDNVAAAGIIALLLILSLLYLVANLIRRRFERDW